MSCILTPGTDVPTIDYGLDINFNELYDNAINQINTQQLNIATTVNNLITSNLDNINDTSFEAAFLQALNADVLLNNYGAAQEPNTLQTEVLETNNNAMSFGSETSNINFCNVPTTSALDALFISSIEFF